MAPLPESTYDYFEATGGGGGDSGWLGLLLLVLFAVCCCCLCSDPDKKPDKKGYATLKEDAAAAPAPTFEKIIDELDGYQQELRALQKLRAQSFSGGAKALMVAMKLRANANRRKKGVLKVRIERAVGLKGGDMRVDVGIRKGVRTKEAGDPYVVVECGNVRLQTAVVPRSLNPVWEQELTLAGSLSDFVASGLRLRVYDKDSVLFADDHLGQVDVSLAGFAVKPSRVLKREASLRPQGTHVEAEPARPCAPTARR